MEQEPKIYKSKEEKIAAREFEATSEKPQTLGDDERIDEIMLEQLGNFSRTKTEQFRETNQNLQEFTNIVTEKFSSEDQREIYDALMLSFTLHMYQEDRKEGSPYVIHPLAVAKKVAELADTSKERVVAALLHDTVEDQADRLSSMCDQKTEGLDDRQRALLEIQRKYGDKVKDIVSQLSNPDFDSILEKQGITQDNPRYRELKNQLYGKHVAEEIEDADVLAVKLIDFSENGGKLSSLPTETPEQKAQKEKFAKKYGPVIPILLRRIERLDNPDIYKGYTTLLKNEGTLLTKAA